MTLDEFKVKLISFGVTFITSFVLGIALFLNSLGTIEWSWAFWGAVIIAGARAGVSAIVANFIPVRLGGKRVK
jgi:hypothetical protein